MGWARGRWHWHGGGPLGAPGRLRLSRRLRQLAHLHPVRLWRRRHVRTVLLGAPMGMGALVIGFAAQGLMPQRSALSGAMLAALLEAPPPRTVADDAREDLRGVEAQRSQAGASGEGPAGAGSLSLAEPAAGTPLNLEIRVALLRQGGSPRLGATGPWWLRSRDGAVLQRGGPGEVPDPGVAGGQGEVWLETSPGQALLVNGQAYAGRLRLVGEGGRLQLVNHLSLEDYIASVVGSEMPSSWNLEALKAQAVAARSYALAHMARPASAHWHLGDTTRWQAYNGLSSSTERTRQAARQTAGLILSYQGGIVESLYAANSQITAEAHGHLGASMSQEGAQALARQGLPYNAILGRYYPGASLARLKAGAG